jgi:UDP-glucuronate 4-epimerase
VYGAARFKDAAARRRLEDAGVRCVPIDLVTGELEGLPRDAEYVLNLAVTKTNDWDDDLDANCGGLALLMEHHQHARAFLHCSSTAVYKPMGHHVFAESDPLGDNHGVWPFLRTYSICKIAAEATARWAARRFSLPTTIARLSVPYGDRGGWPAVHLHMMINGSAIPVHVDAPSVYHPLHEDDVARMVPALLEAASVPATVVNWGGDAAVSIEEWCTYLAGLTGLEARFDPTEHTIDSVQLDLTRMHALAGSTRVHWKDGMRRMVAARHGELLRV